MKSIEAKVVVLGSQGKRLKTFYCVCCIVVVWFGSLRPSQQFFSHVGTYCPSLNQYLADDKQVWGFSETRDRKLSHKCAIGDYVKGNQSKRHQGK